MLLHHYHNMILRAAADPDGDLIARLARQLAACAEAHGILRAKGYGLNGMMIDSTARQVPGSKE